MPKGKVSPKVQELNQQINEARKVGDWKGVVMLTKLKEQAKIEVKAEYQSSDECKRSKFESYNRNKSTGLFLTADKARLTDQELQNWEKIKGQII